MKKILFILSFIVLFTISCNQSVKVKDSIKENIPTKNALIETKNYIDLNETSVKFLFRIKSGSQVELYLGEEIDNLQLVENVSSYDNKGLIVKNLSPNKKYYYKIKTNTNGFIQESSILSFTKLPDTSKWTAPQWAKEIIFYEVFVRTFYDGSGNGIGDFRGLKEKIPYLKELGVEALWLMPINESPSYHGYDVIDYKTIEKDYGTMKDFEDFLAEAKKNDIKVIMDLVVNHSSTEHNWFQKAKAKDAKYRDYYNWASEYDDISKKGPWGQTVWVTKPDVPEYYYAVFWDGMPDLNLRNPEVRKEIIDIAKFWLDKGLDGFRLDAALHIDDFDKDVTHQFWQEFNYELKEYKEDVFLVGENWTTTDKMAAFFKDLDSSFNFTLADMMMSMAKGNNFDILGELKNIHSQYSQYSTNYIDSTFLRNHDQNRVMSELGNDFNKAKLAASLLLTLPGTPFIYYGEEFGQKGTNHPGRDEHVREPMDWYKSATGQGMTKKPSNVNLIYTKSNDGISYEEQKGEENSLFEHYKKLTNIRKANKALYNSNNFEKLTSIPNSTYGYKVGDLYILHNLTNQERQVTLNNGSLDLLSNINSQTHTMKPYGTLILKSNTSLTFTAKAIQWENAYFRGTANNWGASPMTKIAPHIWEIEVTFGSGPAKFKIEKDGKSEWGINYPEQDKVVDSNSTYKITFDDRTGQITEEKIK